MKSFLSGGSRAMPLLAWLLLCAALASPAQAAVSVRVDGRVLHAGAQALPEDSRLATALLAADVAPDAYVTGAAWLRPSLEREQRRLKAGVLFDLRVLVGQARLDDDAQRLALGLRLIAAVGAMPVTGRQPAALLDPRPLELSAQNHRLGNGDRVWLPTRPATVRVVGAVQRTCALAHQPLRDARRYLADCAISPDADPDWLYVIQPDGAVQRLGVALWNRSAPQALAPGALLYVPLRQSLVASVDPAFNDSLAAWLATQPLPGWQP